MFVSPEGDIVQQLRLFSGGHTIVVDDATPIDVHQAAIITGHAEAPVPSHIHQDVATELHGQHAVTIGSCVHLYAG